MAQADLRLIEMAAGYRSRRNHLLMDIDTKSNSIGVIDDRVYSPLAFVASCTALLLLLYARFVSEYRMISKKITLTQEGRQH